MKQRAISITCNLAITTMSSNKLSIVALLLLFCFTTSFGDPNFYDLFFSGGQVGHGRRHFGREEEGVMKDDGQRRYKSICKLHAHNARGGHYGFPICPVWIIFIVILVLLQYASVTSNLYVVINIYKSVKEIVLYYLTIAVLIFVLFTLS